MSDERYVVEARIEQDVMLLSSEAFECEVAVVLWDAFPVDRDMPQTGDSLTVAASSQVLRGEVLGFAVVMKVEP